MEKVWLGQNSGHEIFYCKMAKPCGWAVALALQGLAEKGVVAAFWAKLYL
jgi:hypothetical protein